MASVLGKLISAIFDVSLAAVFLVTWVSPESSLAQPPALLLLIMLIEFITMHSTAMLGSVWMSDKSTNERLRSVGLLTLMYAAFVGAFSAGFSTWAPFIGFWLLTANRVVGMLLGGRPTKQMKEAAERSWARSVVLYIAGAFVTTFVGVPRLGLTPAVMESIDIPGGGVWVEEPWRVLGFGVFYFGLGGVLLIRDALRGPSVPMSAPAEGDQKLPSD